MVTSTEIPRHLKSTVSKAIKFAGFQLSYVQVLYPFAAVNSRGKFECVMTDHHHSSTRPSDMIETLQWQLIDIAVARPVQTVLVYAVYLPESPTEDRDAIAIEVSDENDKTHFFFFTHRFAHGRVVFSGPLTEKTE